MDALLVDSSHPSTGRPGILFAGERFDRFGPVSPSNVAWFEEHLGSPPGGWAAYAERCHSRYIELRRRIGFDVSTAGLIHRVLTALSNREHLMVEGPPASTKTSGIQLAAALLGLPEYRINFSGTTEPDDIVGRYEPIDGAQGARWADGPFARALRTGGIAYLDEINLARPAVVDRLLSALEQRATLTLIERSGELIEAHEAFRAVASINSAESTEGRLPMSAPLRGRFVTVHVLEPNAIAYEAAVRHWAFGRPSETVELLGATWAVDAVFPCELPDLVHIDGIEQFIPRLARFHAELANRCADPSHPIGQDRLERYPVDRRWLWHYAHALDRAAARALSNGACGDFTPRVLQLIDTYYFQTFRPGSDVQQVRDQAKALGMLDLPKLTLSARRSLRAIDGTGTKSVNETCKPYVPDEATPPRGCDLRAWRERAGASKIDAAFLLGASVAAITKFEAAAAIRLPAGVAGRLEELIESGWRRP